MYLFPILRGILSFCSLDWSGVSACLCIYSFCMNLSWPFQSRKIIFFSCQYCKTILLFNNMPLPFFLWFFSPRIIPEFRHYTLKCLGLTLVFENFLAYFSVFLFYFMVWTTYFIFQPFNLFVNFNYLIKI